MLRKLSAADTPAALLQPVSFVVAMVLGFGALSAPYAITTLIRQYFGVPFLLAAAVAITATALSLYAAYVASRAGQQRGTLYLPMLLLEVFSLWGNALLFGA